MLLDAFVDLTVSWRYLTTGVTIALLMLAATAMAGGVSEIFGLSRS